jgi:outer membrane protein assembly factor BamD
LVYRPGEGWTYETPGSTGKWTRGRAREQLEVAQQAFDSKNYGLTIKAARRTVKVWPLSDSAPAAQYLLGRAYEAKGSLERAFNEYQSLRVKYPKFPQYEEVRERQYAIANRYLEGKSFWFKGFLPIGPSMNRTVAMYEKIIRDGPFSGVAPKAQLNIGLAREKQSSFFNRHDPFREAVRAYEVAADRYRDDPTIAAEAQYRAGLAYQKQALKADYDQSVAGQAINTFNDFITLYPDEPRVADAQERVIVLRREQSRGNFAIARHYEKKKQWVAAMIYYNESSQRDPDGPYGEEAKRRLETLKKRTSERTAAAATTPTPPAK